MYLSSNKFLFPFNLKGLGRYTLYEEEEDRAMAKVSGEAPKYSPPKGTSSSLPGCTTEGLTYVIECMTCRKRGIKRTYVGESSRSPYQRGKEHQREVRE